MINVQFTGNTLRASCPVHGIAMYQKWKALGVGLTSVPVWTCPTCETLKKIPSPQNEQSSN